MVPTEEQKIFLNHNSDTQLSLSPDDKELHNEDDGKKITFEQDVQYSQNALLYNSENKKPWNNRIKLLLKKLGEKSMGYRWMHDQENEYYLKLDKNINNFLIILSAIVTALNSTALASLFASEDDFAIIFWLTLINLILSLILTIIIGIKDKSEYGTIAKNHRETSYKFTQIYHSIQEQLSLDVEDREVDKEFLGKKIKEYDYLMQSKPNIRKKIADKYISETKNTNIYKPIITTEFENIDIDVDNADTVINMKSTPENDIKQKKINYEISRWLKNF